MYSDTVLSLPLLRRAAPGALLLLALTAIVGCGHKAAPQPPPNMAPQVTQDITVQQRGYQLRLEFAYPQVAVSGLALPGIAAVEVWRLVTPVPETLLEGDAEELASDPDEGTGAEASDEAMEPTLESVLGEPDSTLEEEGEESGESANEDVDLEEPTASLESQLKADPREFAAAAHS